MIFGAVVLDLTVKAMVRRRALGESRDWWEKGGKGVFGPDPGPRKKRIALFIRWQSTVMSYVLPYFIVLFLLSLVASGGRFLGTLVFFAELVAMVTLGWWLRDLSSKGKVARELDLLSPHSAEVFGIDPGERKPFAAIVALVSTALFFGAASFPYVTVGIGGGKPLPVRVVWSRTADSSAIFSIGRRPETSVYLVESPGDLVGFQTDRDDRSSVVFVPKGYIARIRPAASALSVVGILRSFESWVRARQSQGDSTGTAPPRQK